MTIHVTPREIKKALRLVRIGGKRQSLCCPIALAVRRVIPGAAVGITGISLPDGRRVPLPERAIAVVQDFDNDMEVQPFTFEIQLP